jgi:hypothetical protein
MEGRAPRSSASDDLERAPLRHRIVASADDRRFLREPVTTRDRRRA